MSHTDKHEPDEWRIRSWNAATGQRYQVMLLWHRPGKDVLSQACGHSHRTRARAVQCAAKRFRED